MANQLYLGVCEVQVDCSVLLVGQAPGQAQRRECDGLCGERVCCAYTGVAQHLSYSTVEGSVAPLTSALNPRRL